MVSRYACSMTSPRFFWPSLGRAFAHIWHPRMLLLTLLPFLISGVLAVAMYYFFWGDAIALVKRLLDDSSLLQAAYHWMSAIGLTNANAFLAPLIVVGLSVPMLIVLSLLCVSLLAMPQALRFVSDRRFAALDKRGQSALVQSAASSFAWTAIAVLVLVLSIPLWLIPPLVMVIPPLIWGWLTYKVMSFDALAEHATAEERRNVIDNHKTVLLTMGVLTGFIGAAPSLLWAAGSITVVVLFPLISVISLWLYTLGFVFTALWFVHYCLAALADHRGQQQALDAAFPSVSS